MFKYYFCVIIYFANISVQHSITKSKLSFVGKSKFKYNPSLPDYKTFYIQQQVDHFGFANNASFDLRYLVCDKFWNGDNKPIFFYTGNEGDITLFYQNTGLMFDWAVEFEALIVFCEHRYYGTSMPYGNDSFKDAQHLNYLTAEQALADFVHLIEYLKVHTPGAQKSPVIAFGGSYGGMLSAWIRMKYPFAVAGALAASAPIWQTESCGDFLKVVTNDFKLSGDKCDRVIRNSWKAIDIVGAKDKGLQVLTSIFGLCNQLNTTQALKDWLVGIYSYLAMIDYPYPANFLEPLPAWPIKEVCRHLKNPDLPDVELLNSIRKGVDVYFNYTGASKCYNINHQATSSLDSNGWDYQACTEMMTPSCSDGVNDMFEASPWNQTEYVAECLRKWKVVPRSDSIEEQFGGKDIKYASNIIFSNGLLDPWSTGGVLNSISDSVVAVIIKKGAHHLDLRSSNPLDPADLIHARLIEKAYIHRWIREYYLKAERVVGVANKEDEDIFFIPNISQKVQVTYIRMSQIISPQILIFIFIIVMGYIGAMYFLSNKPRDLHVETRDIHDKPRDHDTATPPLIFDDWKGGMSANAEHSKVDFEKIL